MNEIEKAEKQELAWNGRPARNSEEEVTAILTPMFAAFPNTNADAATFAQYVRMLRDVDPDKLAPAVLKATNTCKFLPTIAEIREQMEQRPPGPRSEGNLPQRRNAPTRMHHLDPEEDKRQRMQRLRDTRGWTYD